MQIPKFFILGCAAFFSMSTMAASEPAELGDLRAKFTKAMDRATEALTIFWSSYRRQLVDLKVKAGGNLEAVLAIEAEMKLAGNRSLGKGAKYQPLKDLQTEFGQLRTDLERQISPDRMRLYGIYYGALQSLEVSLTKENKLDEALQVRRAADQVKTQANSSSAVAGADAPKPNTPVQDPNDPYGVSNAVGHVGGGKPYRDVGADGAALVGFNVVLGPNKDSKEFMKGLTPVYRGKKGETEGRTYGTAQGPNSQRIVAKPGYAVGKITIAWSGLAIHRIKLSFDRIDGQALKSNDGYEGPWVGLDPDGKEEKIDLQGKLPVGIAGSAGLGFDCLGILFLK